MIRCLLAWYACARLCVCVISADVVVVRVALCVHVKASDSITSIASTESDIRSRARPRDSLPIFCTARCYRHSRKHSESRFSPQKKTASTEHTHIQNIRKNSFLGAVCGYIVTVAA